jgi:hypothetical protein
MVRWLMVKWLDRRLETGDWRLETGDWRLVEIVRGTLEIH